MLGWLRDAFANAPSSLSGYHPSVTPSTLFRQRKVVESTRSPSSGSDDDLSQSKDTSFYHNPYHSSGQMNYVDLPQQQYSNERTYPTYLAHQQTIAETDESPSSRRLLPPLSTNRFIRNSSLCINVRMICNVMRIDRITMPIEIDRSRRRRRDSRR